MSEDKDFDIDNSDMDLDYRPTITRVTEIYNVSDIGSDTVATPTSVLVST